MNKMTMYKTSNQKFNNVKVNDIVKCNINYSVDDIVICSIFTSVCID